MQRRGTGAGHGCILPHCFPRGPGELVPVLPRRRNLVANAAAFAQRVRAACSKPALRRIHLCAAEIRGLCGSGPVRRQGSGGVMLDLIIRGGEVVTPQGVIKGEVAIAGETIAAIAAPDTLPSAKRIIDATGHVVMPGGIDPHVHLHHVWIKPDGTPLVTAGPEQVGQAALFGGTTTFIDFAYWRDGASAREAIELRDQDFAGKSPCDWAYHLMLHSEPPPQFCGQLAEAIQAGYPTLKIFTTNILPARSGRMIDFGDIWEAFQVLAK